MQGSTLHSRGDNLIVRLIATQPDLHSSPLGLFVIPLWTNKTSIL